MNLSEIQQKIYDLTNTDSTSYPNSKMLVDLNIWQSYVVNSINDSQDESDFDDQTNTDLPINTTALSTDRAYNIPQSERVISIKNVNISYNGVDWYKATPMDDSEYSFPFPPASATEANAQLDGYFAITAPKYDVKYNTVFIYPKPTQEHVDAGGSIQIEWSREATEITSADLTTGTKVLGFDLAFHPMLCYGPSYEYFVSKKMFDSAQYAKLKLDELDARLRKQYGDKQKDRVMNMRPSDEILQGYK